MIGKESGSMYICCVSGISGAKCGRKKDAEIFEDKIT